ncbi:MAG: L,D-transpeptidase [Polyangiaceae bacterium]|nr:L,D-transpeptidase [Polyangiaceae bacterium]
MMRPSRGWIGALGGALLGACAVTGSGAPPVRTEAEPLAPPPAPSAPDPGDASAAASAPGAPALASASASSSAHALPLASAAPIPSGPHIASVQKTSWIFDRPSKKARQIGYIREGTATPLSSEKPTHGDGCPGGWYAVEPTGFVCKDHTTTLDLSSPRYTALAEAAPARGTVLPYRYAFSRGAPLYNRVPTREEQLKTEGPREKWVEPPPLTPFLSGHEELAQREEIKATDPVPASWKEGAPPGAPRSLVRKWIPHGSMLAYHAAFEAEGRVWLLSPDMTVVPADRVKPFRVTRFQGVKLDEGRQLPMAWTRHDAATRYRKNESGALVSTGETWPPRTAIPVTGERVEVNGKGYLLTREDQVFALEQEVVVATPRERSRMPASIKDDQRWIDVHIRKGTLTAYVGERPVFTTLVSPGAGGYGLSSASNEELVKQSATPLGVYRVTWKTRAAMMSPEDGDPKDFWIADVPYTLYFRPPFAIHVSYWHEDFGMLKSSGCINVSPEDGRFLYDWSDPPTPPSWQGSGPGKGMGVGTLLVISP